MKVFRVTGEIRKPNLETTFKQEVVAAKREHAIERIYAELGSRHRVKRFYIKITSVEEVPLKEVVDPTLREFVAGDKKVGE